MDVFDIVDAARVAVRRRRLGHYRQPFGGLHEAGDRPENDPKDEEADPEGCQGGDGAVPDGPQDALGAGPRIAERPVMDDERQDDNPAEDDRDQDIETQVYIFSFHYLTILVMSHIGMKMARAKNPTTAASTTIRLGPIRS